MRSSAKFVDCPLFHQRFVSGEWRSSQCTLGADLVLSTTAKETGSGVSSPEVKLDSLCSLTSSLKPVSRGPNYL